MSDTSLVIAATLAAFASYCGAAVKFSELPSRIALGRQFRDMLTCPPEGKKLIIAIQRCKIALHVLDAVSRLCMGIVLTLLTVRLSWHP